MARASRSNKKQPAFDPSELTDLIFSPAVGSGVGSHLLGTAGHIQADCENEKAEQSNTPTVDTCIDTTVDKSCNHQPDTAHLTTVDNSRDSEVRGFRSAFSILKQLPVLSDHEGPLTSYMSTVAIINIATVGESAIVQPADNSTHPGADKTDLSTVAKSQSPTIDNFDAPTGANHRQKLPPQNMH
jgi:hypothetical protein